MTPSLRPLPFVLLAMIASGCGAGASVVGWGCREEHPRASSAARYSGRWALMGREFYWISAARWEGERRVRRGVGRGVGRRGPAGTCSGVSRQVAALQCAPSRKARAPRATISGRAARSKAIAFDECFANTPKSFAQSASPTRSLGARSATGNCRCARHGHWPEKGKQVSAIRERRSKDGEATSRLKEAPSRSRGPTHRNPM